MDAARGSSNHVRLLEWTALCRGLLERAMEGLPPSLRAKMRELPFVARVLAGASSPVSVPEQPNQLRWRELVRASRRLFAEKRPKRIAQRAADIALDLVHAERALVVLEREGGGLEVLARAELRGSEAPDLGFSKSVVQRAWLDAAPVVTVEASADARFDTAQSVHTLSVRSVLAVPLEGFSARAVLYLDDRLRAAAFHAEDQQLLLDVAELARQALRAGQAVVMEQQRARVAEQSTSRLERQLERMASAPRAPLGPVPLVWASPAMGQALELARRVAAADVPLLISGESGSGKELIARFVHAESARRGAPFVAENCAALPDTLLESALFGHVRGAFTGAERARRGLFEVADGGTLLLDEVAEMSPALQSKLLRVLQEREFRALGSERVRRVDVRVIAATHRDLLGLVREGRFREDLYYRLAVVTLEVPPLAQRAQDIPLLVQHFVREHARERNVKITPAAMRALEAKHYPGNVRQLENEVRRALALCDGEIRPEHVTDVRASSSATEPSALDLHEQTEALTRRLVERAMAQVGGNVSQAAQLLGISRFGLQKIMKRLSAGRTGTRQRK
jgi:transcriptional regulator with GAF, ATPase, and Fis domain